MASAKRVDGDAGNFFNLRGAAIANTTGPVPAGGSWHVRTPGVGARGQRLGGGLSGRLRGNVRGLGGTA